MARRAPFRSPSRQGARHACWCCSETCMHGSRSPCDVCDSNARGHTRSSPVAAPPASLLRGGVSCLGPPCLPAISFGALHGLAGNMPVCEKGGIRQTGRGGGSQPYARSWSARSRSMTAARCYRRNSFALARGLWARGFAALSLCSAPPHLRLSCSA